MDDFYNKCSKNQIRRKILNLRIKEHQWLNSRTPDQILEIQLLLTEIENQLQYAEYNPAMEVLDPYEERISDYYNELWHLCFILLWIEGKNDSLNSPNRFDFQKLYNENFEIVEDPFDYNVVSTYFNQHWYSAWLDIFAEMEVQKKESQRKNQLENETDD